MTTVYAATFAFPWDGVASEMSSENFCTELRYALTDGVVGKSGIVYSVGAGQEIGPYVTGSDMVVSFKAGAGIVSGHGFVFAAPVDVTVSAAHATLPRIDRVFLRWASAAKASSGLVYVTGTADANPENYKPAPTWTSTVHDVYIAEIYVNAAATTIASMAWVTDQRQRSTGNSGHSHGDIVFMHAALGGSDGHRPIVGGTNCDAADVGRFAKEEWHLANGDNDPGDMNYAPAVIPDLRGKFLMGASSGHADGTTGGAETINLEHSHTQSVTSGEPSATTTATAGATVTVPTLDHTHVVVSPTENALSTAQSILPPYKAKYAFYFVC